QELRDDHRGGRVALARLEHESVSSRDRERKHPTGHHAGKVEGRDAGDDSERLAQRPVVHPARDLVGEVSLEELRNAAGEFHDVDRARHLALRIGKYLAVLRGDEGGDLVATAVQELEKPEQHAGTAQRRRLRPGREGSGRARDGALHDGGIGEGKPACDLTGRWIEDVLGAAGIARYGLTADEVAEEAIAGRGGGGARCGCHGGGPGRKTGSQSRTGAGD